MTLLKSLQSSIQKVGIKEVARRSGLSPSTVSRVSSGQMNPTLEVVEKISSAIGMSLKLETERNLLEAPRLRGAQDILRRLRNQLKIFGVRHATIFGSTARGEDKADSDVDIYLDFGDKKIPASQLLKAEGIVLNAFGENKIDIVSQFKSSKAQQLKKRITDEGIDAF